jgi:hypothetical protein
MDMARVLCEVITESLSISYIHFCFAKVGMTAMAEFCQQR